MNVMWILSLCLAGRQSFKSAKWRTEKMNPEDDLRLIFHALAALKLASPIKPEPEDLDAAVRRQWAATESMSDSDIHRLAQARFIVRKVASYYKGRHEEPDLVGRLEDGLAEDEWPSMG
jgi:hypothetical protein